MKEKLFSVLMSVYCNDNPKYLRAAVESVSIKQTLQPKELILVVDGPVPELVKSEIKALCREIPYIKTLWKPLNEGLGKALRDGVLIANYHIIARMDSDDIAYPDRCEKQVAIFNKYPIVSICSVTVMEFSKNPETINCKRVLPEKNKEIIEFAKKRNPFNHPCVMYKKSAVEAVGSYRHFYLLGAY